MMDAPTVSIQQARAFRVIRQQLAPPLPAGSLLEAVRAAHGIQAQVSAHAIFAVGQRVDGCTPEEITRALWQDRTLVKTWAMRGTVHWLTADEEPLYVRGLSELHLGYIYGYYERNGVSREQLRELLERVLEALDGQALTRQEVAAAVRPRVGAWAEPFLTTSWGGVMRMLCMEGLTLFGPPEGSRITFVRRDQWLPPAPEIDPQEARRELLRRYLRTFGPSTLSDFSYWLGPRIRELTPTWDSLLPELAEVSMDGKRRWLLRDDVEALLGASLKPGHVRLVPAFDPILLAHKDKGELLDMRFHKRVYGAAAWVYPSVLVDGEVRAIWSYARKGKALVITVKPFTRLNQRVMNAVAREADRLAAMHGLIGAVIFLAE